MHRNVKVIFPYIGVFLVLMPWIFPLIYGPNPLVLAEVIVFASLLLLFLLSVPLYQSILIGLVLAAVLNALVGLLQYFNLADGFYPYLIQQGPGQAFGIMGQRNQLASLTSIGYVSVLIGAQSNVFRSVFSIKWIYGFLAMLAIGNAVSMSRTGLIQWTIILIIHAMYSKDKWGDAAKQALFAFATYCLAIVMMPWFLSQMLGEDYSGLLSRFGNEENCGTRSYLWLNVLELIGKQPLMGWGWGELKYAHFITLLGENRFCEVLGNAHNLPLHLAVTFGIPIALIVAIILICAVIYSKPWMEAHIEKKLAWSILLLVGVHSMLEYPLWYAPFQMVTILSIVILIRWERVLGPGGGSYWGVTRQGLGRNAGIMLLIAFLFFGYVVWDYFRISRLYKSEFMKTAEDRVNTLTNAKKSYFFKNYVNFAELGMLQLEAENASFVNELAKEMLHFSPEPKVIKLVVESARLLGNEAEVEFYSKRFAAAFPREYAGWVKGRNNLNINSAIK